MDKTLLKQVLKLKDEKTTYSKIEKLIKKIQEYQQENELNFIYAKYREKVKILDEKLFFEFVNDELLKNNILVDSFEEIENILNTSTREENIKLSGDSKNSIIKVFDKIIVFQYKDSNPILYKNISDIKIDGVILAVENGEIFLKIDSIMSKFGYKNYLYLGGFSNTLTREFLKDKEVVFFLDYDIEAIRIYDSFKCKKKSFFKYPNIEKYFKDNPNIELYKKQRYKLPEFHNELQWLIELIKDNDAVVEQEVIK